MSTGNLSDPEKRLLKYYNIYRRDIAFREGVIGTAFQLVDRIPIDATSMTDSSDADLAPINYTKSLAPPSADIVEVGRVVFLGGVKPAEIAFPHPFDRYVEMTIHNKNEIDYVNPIIELTLNSVVLGIDSWEDYLDNNGHKIRIYMVDAITPVPVVTGNTDDLISNLKIYIKPPYLSMATKNIFYIAIADEASGVPAEYDTYRLGKFYTSQSSGGSFTSDINRPLNSGHKICTNVPYDPSFISDKTYLFNLSNMLTQGNVKDIDGDSADWTAHSIGGSTFTHSYEMPSNGTHVHYELLAAPKLPLLGLLDVEHTPRGLKSGNLTYDTILEIGNLKLVHVYSSSSGVAAFYLVTFPTVVLSGSGTSQFIFSYPSTGEQKRIRLSLYVTATYLRLYVYDIWDYGLSESPSEFTKYVDGSTGYPAIVPDKNVYLFRPQVPDESFSQNGTNRVRRFDLLESQTMSSEEIARAMLYLAAARTFAREPLEDTVTFEQKDFRSVIEPTNVMWSDLNGSTFSSLDFKKMSEPVLRIIVAPSFLKQQYESTLIVFSRNRVTRIVLNADMTASNSVQVEEHVSGGLYSPRSLISGGSTLFWLSEDGVMGWSAEGLANLSKGIIDIPMDNEYVGAWVAQNSQYLLHSLNSGISYVYHTFNGKWTTFTGIQFIRTSSLNLGKNMANKMLLLQDDGTLSEYPGTAATTAQKRIITKEFYTGNVKALRFRCLWERGKATDKITARTFNHRLSDQIITKEYNSPKRYEWLYLPNGLWGEMLQFSIDNATALSKIDIDLRED